MITGDHPLTARYIAAKLGIMKTGPFVTGPEIDQLTSADLQRRSEGVPPYARVSPEHKLKIVESLQQSRHIVAAVEESRVIYDNIRKFIKYILATNTAEIWVMLAAPFLGMPLALLPLQILWMNLVTDGLPALALSAEPPASNTMQRPPYPPSEIILARGMGRHVVWAGMLMGLLSLGIGYWYWKANDPNWQSMTSTTLTFSQMAHILAIRSGRHSLSRAGLFSNKPFLGAVCLTIVLQLALLYVAGLRQVFRTTALSPVDLAATAAFAAVIFCAVELEKYLLNQTNTL